MAEREIIWVEHKCFDGHVEMVPTHRDVYEHWHERDNTETARDLHVVKMSTPERKA